MPAVIWVESKEGFLEDVAPHSLEQPAQETNPLSIINTPGSQPKAISSDNPRSQTITLYQSAPDART